MEAHQLEDLLILLGQRFAPEYVDSIVRSEQGAWLILG